VTPDSRVIEDLFERALDLEPAERDAWLLEASQGDEALAGEVRTLLAAHARRGILEGDAMEAARALLDRPARGMRIGPYRVERELGRGGMGVVYLADRDDGQFRRRVAIKVLRAGADSEELLQRFAAERQILASLNHPNIAQLLDGGVGAGQAPYLVMEFVDGLSITAYADAQGLRMDARLRLFQDVCAAVHYAHQNLVLHRDLKPGNIFVTARGEVKLLDFGIAKLLNPGLGTMPAPVTRTELRILTPDYASPEQVRGAPLTTASDVYSLGIVLYELLAGHRPYRITSGSPREMSELVLEREPERPSERVMRVGEPTEGEPPPPTPGEIAAARGLAPDRLRRRLQGDLDAIVLMALRKEPARRYGSAELLSQDIQRHLDGAPVLAHRGSRTYRLRRFVARHRVQAAAAAIVVAAVVGGVGVSLRWAAVAGAARDRAERSRAQAEEALERSEAVTSFLTWLFESAVPEASPGDTVTARQLVRRGMERVAELSAQPLVQARMLESIGRLHFGFAQYSDARQVLERSLALREAAGESLAQSTSTRRLLGEVMRRRGDYAEGERFVRVSLASLERADSSDPGVPTLQIELGAILVYRGALAEAESLAHRALELRRRHRTASDSLVPNALEHLASLQRRRANNVGAEASLRESIAMRQRYGGPNDLGATFPIQRLADLELELYGRPAVAESLYRQAYGILRRELGDANPRVAYAAGDLASALEQLGQRAEAERLFREGHGIAVRAFGNDHPAVAGGLMAIAGVVWRSDRRQEAIALSRRALDVYARALGPRHAAYAATLVQLGEMLSVMGSYQEADSILRLGLTTRSAAVGNHNPTVGIGLAIYGTHLTRQRRYAAADSVFREALAAMRPEIPDTHRDVKAIYRQMADMYRAWGKAAEAERYARLASSP
jgi:serine/threonine-protein kinase